MQVRYRINRIREFLHEFNALHAVQKKSIISFNHFNHMNIFLNIIIVRTCSIRNIFRFKSDIRMASGFEDVFDLL